MGRWAERSLNRDKIAAMLELAKSDPRIAITTGKLDQNQWLLNFTNGTVDLRTGVLREHRHDDYITKLVRHAYRPDLVAPRWLYFVGQTFGDLADWSQKAVGYSVTGLTTEKAVFLLLGRTDTGKTTFLTTLRRVFADYSALLQIDTLMWARYQDNNTSADLADLRAARLVVTSETEEGQRLREAKLKRITQGMGEIKAVRKYENPFTFPETHKLWIDANHAPIVRGTDDAIWTRLLPIPCNHRLALREKDIELAGKLLAEGEGIAAWAVAGAVRWSREGLGRPDPIEETCASWREQMDTLGEFLAECCIEGEGESEGGSELYGRYRQWAEEHGLKDAMTATGFGIQLTSRGFRKRKDSKTRRIAYFGLGLQRAFSTTGGSGGF
ncbi:MAG TPA: phage/plasmid primase, P4 family [Candidatus Acidoferrales bacterium]|nr:phage/plasmid primase, P4 family [Candidatus Acidoferrales bacterium]